jgi:hypothetical protein
MPQVPHTPESLLDELWNMKRSVIMDPPLADCASAGMDLAISVVRNWLDMENDFWETGSWSDDPITTERD